MRHVKRDRTFQNMGALANVLAYLAMWLVIVLCMTILFFLLPEC